LTLLSIKSQQKHKNVVIALQFIVRRLQILSRNEVAVAVHILSVTIGQTVQF